MILPLRLTALHADGTSTSLDLVGTVDPTSPHLCIPSEIAERLSLQSCDTRAMRTTGGETLQCPYVGPLMVEAKGVRAYAGAVACGSEVVVGHSALASLGLVADEVFGKVYQETRHIRTDAKGA